MFRHRQATEPKLAWCALTNFAQNSTFSARFSLNSASIISRKLQVSGRDLFIIWSSCHEDSVISIFKLFLWISLALRAILVFSLKVLTHCQEWFLLYSITHHVCKCLMIIWCNDGYIFNSINAILRSDRVTDQINHLLAKAANWLSQSTQ